MELYLIPLLCRSIQTRFIYQPHVTISPPPISTPKLPFRLIISREKTQYIYCGDTRTDDNAAGAGCQSHKTIVGTARTLSVTE